MENYKREREIFYILYTLILVVLEMTKGFKKQPFLDSWNIKLLELFGCLKKSKTIFSQKKKTTLAMMLN